MIIEINGKEYKLVYNIQSIMIFENLADKAFALDRVTDWMFLAFAALVTGTPDSAITFDDFTKWVGQEKNLSPIVDWLKKRIQVEQDISGDTTEEDEVKKK